jgi:hypothetical protein
MNNFSAISERSSGHYQAWMWTALRRLNPPRPRSPPRRVPRTLECRWPNGAKSHAARPRHCRASACYWPLKHPDLAPPRRRLAVSGIMCGWCAQWSAWLSASPQNDPEPLAGGRQRVLRREPVLVEQHCHNISPGLKRRLPAERPVAFLVDDRLADEQMPRPAWMVLIRPTERREGRASLQFEDPTSIIYGRAAVPSM